MGKQGGTLHDKIEMYGNEAYIASRHIPVGSNESYVTSGSLRHSNEPEYAYIEETLDVKMQGNDAYKTSRHIPVGTNESYATTILTQPNQAYGIKERISHEYF